MFKAALQSQYDQDENYRNGGKKGGNKIKGYGLEIGSFLTDYVIFVDIFRGWMTRNNIGIQRCVFSM